MKVLIIGSNSFSGSNLINYLLKKNHRVIGVSRSNQIHDIFLNYKSMQNLKNFSFKKIDLNKNIISLSNLIKKERPSHIINFAAQGMVAQSWENPIHWYNTNFISQIKFHEELMKFKFIEKYIHFTTPEVYGSTNSWIKENYIFSPSTPYAVSRAACDMHLLSFYNAYKFPVVFTRAANVYGPGQQLYRIVPRTILFSILNNQMVLHGGGKSVRSFIHIEDVADAVYKILKNGKIGSTYHISTNEIISIKNLVVKICGLTKTNHKHFVKLGQERVGKDQAYLLDSNKLRKELKWKDKITLEDGLIDTIKWVKNNLKLIKTLPFDYQHKE